MLSLGDFAEVRIPPIEQGGLRDVSRAREHAVVDLPHARQRITAKVLCHGLRYPKDAEWIGAQYDWLAPQCLDSAAS